MLIKCTNEGNVPMTAEEEAAFIAGQAASNTIEMQCAAAWESIKTERDRRRFYGGVKVGVHWFLSTETATGEYSAMLAISAGLADTTILRAGWRTMDGATVDMTPALAKQVLLAGFNQVASIDDAAQAHKVAMEASADPAAYDFSQGWPLVYGE